MKKGELRAVVESYIATHTVTPHEARKLSKLAKRYFKKHGLPRSVKKAHKVLDDIQEGLDDSDAIITLVDGTNHVAIFATVSTSEWSEQLEAALEQAMDESIAVFSHTMHKHGVEDSPLNAKPRPKVKDKRKKFGRLLRGIDFPDEDPPGS